MEHRVDLPFWVYLCLAHVKTRTKAHLLLIFFIVCFFLMSTLSYVTSEWRWSLISGSLVVWIFLSIRWIDRYSTWDTKIDEDSNHHEY